MNILVHSHLYPNKVYPHRGLFVNYFVEALAQLGHSVSVVSPIPYVPFGIPRTNPWYMYKNIPKKRVVNNIVIYHPRFLSIPRRLLFFLRGTLMYWSASRSYKKIIQSEAIEIIHSHVALPDGQVGMLLSKKYNIPYGVTIHGADLFESVPESRFNYLIIKKTIENAKFIGLVSSKLGQLLMLKKINPPRSTTKIIYNGIKVPTELTPIELPEYDENAINLISVGMTIKRKGIDYVLKALSKLRTEHQNLRYYVVGEGIDLNYFKNTAHQVGVNDITHFLGGKDNREIFSYLNACDVFVLPSWDEAFGIVYIEAMSLGKIVMGCLGEGIAEIIEDGTNGFLVHPKDENSLYRKLNFVLHNLNKLDEVQKNAIKTVNTQFTWQNNARNYSKLYDMIISQGVTTN